MSTSKKRAIKSASVKGVMKKAGAKPSKKAKAQNVTELLPRSHKILNAYLEKIRVWHGYARFIGLPALIESSKDVPLQRLYVPPHLSESPITPEAMNGEPPPILPLVPALVENQRLVVLGDPGSGKSTLVNYISEALARQGMAELRHAVGKDMVPLPFILRELNVSEKVTWDSLRDAFLQRPVGLALGDTLEQRQKIFDQLMSSGQGWVMLDGLDEIGSVSVRSALRWAYFEAVERFPECRFLLTSRIIGYDEVSFHGLPIATVRRINWLSRYSKQLKQLSPGELSFAEELSVPSWAGEILEAPTGPELGERLQRLVASWVKEGASGTRCLFMAPFNDTQVREFTQNWWTHHRANPAVAAAEANDFLGALHAKHDTRTLGRVPNLLVLIALIYKVFIKLPDGRADLYAKIVEAYLENIDRHYKLKSPLPYSSQQMARWLAHVAWEMQMRRYRDALAADVDADDTQQPASDILVTRNEAHQWIADAIAHQEGLSPSEAQSLAATFLDYAARRSGLFVPRGEDAEHRDLFAFMHLSFQEYFCALHLSAQVSTMSWWKKNIFTHAGDSSPFSLTALRDYAAGVGWTEVFVFLFEMLKAGDPERPLSMLRVLLGENEEGTDWQKLDAPFPDPDDLFESPSDSANPPGPLAPTRIAHARVVELAASLSMNSEVKMSSIARSGLLRRCWEWEVNRVRQPTQTHISSPVARILLSRCAHIHDSLAQLQALSEIVTTLNLRGCSWLKSLEMLELMIHLRWLDISGCSEISSLTPLEKLDELETLIMGGQLHLSSLKPLENIKNLSRLTLPHTTTSESLGVLKQLSKLWSLNMSRCEALTSLEPLGEVTSLKNLSLIECKSLTTLEPLRKLRHLSILRLNGCVGIQSLEPLQKLRELKSLVVIGCAGLNPDDLDDFQKSNPGCKVVGLSHARALRLRQSKEGVLPLS